MWKTLYQYSVHVASALCIRKYANANVYIFNLGHSCEWNKELHSILMQLINFSKDQHFQAEKQNS